MDQNTFSWNDKVYSNNNNLLLEIIDDLNQLLKNTKDDSNTKILENIINKINNIINENKKIGNQSKMIYH